MKLLLHRARRRGVGPFGLLLAAFALLGQLMLGAATMPAAASPLGEVPICHADDGGVPATPAGHRHHGADCALCPLCAALTQPAAALAAPPVLPAPRLVAAPRPSPPARAPPPATPTRLAAQPRGPPPV